MSQKYREELWSRALEIFRSNRLALSAGKIEWTGGRLADGRAYNSINWLAPEGGASRKVFCSYEKTHDGGRRFRYVADEVVPAAAYLARAEGYATWCHMAASIWSEVFAGAPLNVFGGKEHNANRTFQLMRNGSLAPEGFAFREVELDEALELAAESFPVFACAAELGRYKIGHISVVQKDGLTVQAGAKTGEGISHSEGFGIPAERIPHFVLESTGEGDPDDEEEG